MDERCSKRMETKPIRTADGEKERERERDGGREKFTAEDLTSQRRNLKTSNWRSMCNATNTWWGKRAKRRQSFWHVSKCLNMKFQFQRQSCQDSVMVEMIWSSLELMEKNSLIFASQNTQMKLQVMTQQQKEAALHVHSESWWAFPVWRRLLWCC